MNAASAFIPFMEECNVGQGAHSPGLPPARHLVPRRPARGRRRAPASAMMLQASSWAPARSPRRCPGRSPASPASAQQLRRRRGVAPPRAKGAAADDVDDLVSRLVGFVFGKQALQDPAPAGLKRMSKEEWPDQARVVAVACCRSSQPAPLG